MASAFGHALASYAIGKSYSKQIVTRKFILLGIICSILPDADVLAFTFEIPYEHMLGHRGFTHSILFALILAVGLTALFYRSALFNLNGIKYISYFFLCTISHAILDAMTTGGLGVGFLIPWDEARYFFPFRPIKVSPIGIERFFSEWGLRVLLNELLWIGIPSILYIAVLSILRRKTSPKTDQA